MPDVGGCGVQVLAHLTVLVDCPGKIQTEVQNILKIVGFRSGSREPVTRIKFTNCFAYMKANLFVIAQLSTLSKLILLFESQSSN